MLINRRVLTAAIAFGALAAVAVRYDAALGQAGNTKPSGVVKIVSVIGKPMTSIEATLGKPQRSGKDTEGAMMDWSVYSVSGTQGVLVRYSGKQAAQYEVSFAQTVTWQAAVNALGLDAAKLKPGAMPNIPGMTKLSGHTFKDWNLYFTVAGAHYPNGGKLINTNQGLPMIEFEQKSLNE